MENNQTKSKRGGYRPGSGRPRGAPNKANIARQAEVAATGETPLDFLLKVMRDAGEDGARRLDAAKAAAPYVHPKLSAVTVAGDEDGAPIKHEFSWLPEGS